MGASAEPNMSQDAVVSRKEKKAQRDAERHRKGKKRKQDESEVTGDQAHVAGNEKNVLALETGEAEAPAKAPQSKKRKASENDEEGGPEDVAPKENSEGKAKAQQKKRKKQKTDTTEGAVETGEADAASKDRKDRFVVFIGAKDQKEQRLRFPRVRELRSHEDLSQDLSP